MLRHLPLIAAAVLSLVTVLAVAEAGVTGVFRLLLGSWSGRQAFLDLVIALAFVLAWLVPDARRRGRRAWPWVLATLAAGSLGPLLYVIVVGARSGPTADPAPGSAR